MFSRQQMRFFDRAADIALESEFDVFHVGCIAVLKNKIIAASPNKLKTHPVQAVYDKYRYNCDYSIKNMHTLHAEIACLTQIKQDIDYTGLEVYVVRIKKNGDYGMARPCASCMPFLINKGVRKIFYSTNYGFCNEIVGKC
jgi:deoxycytidylate deaminase